MIARISKVIKECDPTLSHEEMPLNDNHLPSISDPSQLFTVRVWKESVQHGSPQVRVQVKHVLSGATRTFSEWSQVLAFIVEKMQAVQEILKATDDERR
jgi:hypothetical protein